MIELAAGAWRARLRPEIGGCVAALTRDGVPVLRTMGDEANHPLQSSCFPMVPYCNRIAAGHFAWREREITIAPNLPPHPHPLHGLGWLTEWRVVRSDRVSALLEHAYDGAGEWPWAYVAHQHVALDASGLTLRLMVQNRAVEPAPMGLGLHPYFRRAPDSVVTFDAKAMLGIDAEFLPDGKIHDADALAPWSKGVRLPDRLVDNSFAHWSGGATITDSQGAITLRGFGAPYCHVFAPPGGEELCLEPTSHTPDALNRASQQMTALPPGCAAGIAMRIEASPSD